MCILCARGARGRMDPLQAQAPAAPLHIRANTFTLPLRAPRAGHTTHLQEDSVMASKDEVLGKLQQAIGRRPSS